MSLDRSTLDGMTRKERRDLSREVARMKREEEQRRRRRNRLLRWVMIAVGGAAVLAIAALLIINAVRASQIGPANMISDGVVLRGDGSTLTAVASAALQPDEQPVTTVPDPTGALMSVTEYFDYGSEDSAIFDTTNGANLQGWSQAGYVSLELHPVSVLDDQNGGYSTRAANALACVADTIPNGVIAVHNALIAAQADLDADGLSNDELVGIINKTGIENEAVTGCVRAEEFADWVSAATIRARESVPNSDIAALKEVPLVLVNQIAWAGAVDDADAFAEHVSGSYSIVGDSGANAPGQ